MKNNYLLLFAMLGLGLTSSFAATHTVTISGTTYTPATVDAAVGDEVIISASGSHPLMQVSQATWDANGNTQLAGGFGIETSTYTYTVTSVGTIYFVCQFHASMGMKGVINVSAPTGVNDLGVTSLNIYPNPVMNGAVTIAGDDASLKGSIVELYNTNGQLVGSMPVESQVVNFGTSMATGTYTAVIVRGGKALLRQRLLFVSSEK